MLLVQSPEGKSISQWNAKGTTYEEKGKAYAAAVAALGDEGQLAAFVLYTPPVNQVPGYLLLQLHSSCTAVLCLHTFQTLVRGHEHDLQKDFRRHLLNAVVRALRLPRHLLR